MEGPAAMICRICQGEEPPLIQPCRCEGSMAFVHPYCLAEWITSRGQLSCEICGTAYSFQIAVNDVPPLRSVGGAVHVAKLFVRAQLRRLVTRVGKVGRAVAFVVAVIFGCTAVWLCCWRLVFRSGGSTVGRRVSLPVLFTGGFVLNIIPLLLLLCYERFTVWAFVYEDAIADLPPVPPVHAPPETPADEATTTAINLAFTNPRRSGDLDGDHVADNEGNGDRSSTANRYIAAHINDGRSDSILQLLRRKVNKTKRRSQRRRFWDSTALHYVVALLLIHAALATAVVVGDAALQCLAAFTRVVAFTVGQLMVTKEAALWIFLREALTAKPLSSVLYWCVAFVVGIVSLLYPLRLAAAHLASTHAHLSRTFVLSRVFARSALSIVLMALIWATVVPTIVYACLFPFFVEGDATVMMPPKEAMGILRAERLLPFQCRRLASGSAAASVRSLTQPLNVLRALVFAAPDVLRGQSPPLFDRVSCGLDVAATPASRSPTQHFVSQALNYACFCGCVLLRVCTLPTWLTLVGTLRATLLWLVSGALTMFLPYTSLMKRYNEQHDLFHTFTRLKGQFFWRVLLEIPCIIALYTLTAGFFTFTALYRLSPEAFPRSVSYLSFYTLANRLSDFDFVYNWFRVIYVTHHVVQRGLQRLFLSRDATTPAARDHATSGDDVVERVAYAVCLLCVNVVIGILLEWVSWNSWFPLLCFFVNLLSLSWLGMLAGGGLPPIRRRLTSYRVQATMLCFYGTWVTFKDDRDVCVCAKLTCVRPNTVTSGLLCEAYEQNDERLLVLLSALLDRHTKENIVCSRELLQRFTTHTLTHIITYPRMAVVATLIAVAPLVLCSVWHLDFVTRVSTDYVALPLWFCLLVRWVIGAVAGVVWLLMEGVVFRTSLSRRCLQFAPLLILGHLPFEVVHAVFIPLIIHCGAARLAIAVLEYLPHNTATLGYNKLPAAGTVLLISACLTIQWIRAVVRRAVLPFVRDGLQRWMPPVVVEVPAANNAPPVAGVLRQQEGDNGDGVAEPAPLQPNAAEAAVAEAEEGVKGRERHGTPAAAPFPAEAGEVPLPPPPPTEAPPPQRPQRMQCLASRLEERIARWAASECATDVVLVSHTHSPLPPSAEQS